jgi:two-component system phosphate regulon sensor histidine kinase PhoR
MYLSTRWRIAIPFAILILLTTLGIGIYLTNYVRQIHLQEIETNLLNQASLISDALASQDLDSGASPEINQLARHWSDLLGSRITIIDRKGVVLGESEKDPAQMDNHLDRPEVQEALQDGVGVSTRYSQTVNYRLFYVALPIYAGDTLTGFARVALPLETIQGTQTQLRNTVILTAFAAAGIAMLFSIFIATQTTSPLIKLTKAAQEMVASDPMGFLPSNRQDEIGQLTQAFNALIRKLWTQILALQSEQGKLNAILQQMTDGLVIINQGGNIILVNPAAENMFHLDAESAVGRSAAEVLRYHQWVELWQDCQKSGEEQSATLELPRQQAFIQGIAISLENELPGHILLLFQDLTRMRRLETVRKDFISNISHELRTPLASLKALTETLQSGALEDPPAARRFLSRIETEVNALSHMVSELLELSRIESGQVPLELKPLLPYLFTDSVLERLGMQAEKAGVDLRVDTEDQLPRINADEPRLEQVFVNIVHNAIKFTDPGGMITISAHRKGGYVQFSVEDTGKGIPAEDLPRIFERFYKTDQARASRGTGLGLAIARHIVGSHGGDIWAESEYGTGSTFYFTIPIAR